MGDVEEALEDEADEVVDAAEEMLSPDLISD